MANPKKTKTVPKKSSKKVPAPCPLAEKTVKKTTGKPAKKKGIKSNPLIFQRRIIHDGAVRRRKKVDLTRFVKWPKNIRIQRKKQILMQRLKVPPVINQFRHTLPKDQKKDLFAFLKSYRPESAAEKKQRLVKQAEDALEKKNIREKKAICLKHGVNHVTNLIEKNKAKLVVIANDVHPIELVLFLPTLCRLKNVPYCIVSSRASLGTLVHMKRANVICLDGVSKSDMDKLEYFSTLCREQYNDNVEIRRKWGGQILSGKSMQLVKLREKAQKLEEAKKKEISEKL